MFAFLNNRLRLACLWTLHKWNNLCVLDDVLSLTLGDSWRKLTVLCLFPAHGSVWTECNTAYLPILQWWVFAWFLPCCYYEQCFLNILVRLLVPSVSIPLGSSVGEPNCWVMSSVLPRWHQGSPKGIQAVQETPSAFCSSCCKTPGWGERADKNFSLRFPSYQPLAIEISPCVEPVQVFAIHFCWDVYLNLTFHSMWWLSGKESTHQSEDKCSIHGLGRSPGEGNGNPLHFSCLENPMDRGAWGATVHGVTKSRTWVSGWTTFIYLSICYLSLIVYAEISSSNLCLIFSLSLYFYIIRSL